MSTDPETPWRSALYEGTVTHRRSEPAHAFGYRVALPLLFLDELRELRRVHPLVDFDLTAHRRLWPAAMRLRRHDFLPSDSRTLLQAVTEVVEAAGGRVRGPVAMLGQVRTWGWLFNPLTLYYCFDASGQHVETTVLEVSNTPWHERCHYVVGPPGTHRFAKAMHVSPFLPDVGTYTLRYSAPSGGLRVGLHLDAPEETVPYCREDEPNPRHPVPQLAASMVLRRHPLDRAGLGRLLWSHPLMTTRVSAGVYAQALRLASRRAPFHRHPGRGEPAGTCPAPPPQPMAVLEHSRD